MLNKYYIIIISLYFIIGCATEDTYDLNSAQGSFSKAQYLEKEERFQEAIIEYQNVKNKFPYNKLAILSELKIADIQYNREAFIEAQHAYQLFKELHPKNIKNDYITFRLAMSYFHQLPTSLDRDLSLAHDAIIYFDEVQLSYPSSPYVKESKKIKSKIRTMLGKKELYIAQFYFIRKKYNSALKRYEKIIQKYASFEFIPKALYGAAISSDKIKEKEKSKKYYQRLIKQYASSNEAKRIQKEYENDLR